MYIAIVSRREGEPDFGPEEKSDYFQLAVEQESKGLRLSRPFFEDRMLIFSILDSPTDGITQALSKLGKTSYQERIERSYPPTSSTPGLKPRR